MEENSKCFAASATTAKTKKKKKKKKMERWGKWQQEIFSVRERELVALATQHGATDCVIFNPRWVSQSIVINLFVKL
jgi:hypothetical protein